MSKKVIALSALGAACVTGNSGNGMAKSLDCVDLEVLVDPVCHEGNMEEAKRKTSGCDICGHPQVCGCVACGNALSMSKKA